MVKAERGSSPNGVKIGRGFRIENGHEPTFASTFAAAARGCGIRTLTEFSHGSGVGVDVLSLWVNERAHPLPASLEAAVSYLRERGAPEEALGDIYGQYNAYRQVRTEGYQERVKVVARKERTDPPLPLGRFIDQLADSRGVTINGLNKLLGSKYRWLSRIRIQSDMSQETLLKLLKVLGNSGILTDEEMVQMEEAAGKTIVQIVEGKGRMIPVSPLSVKRQQEENPSCDTSTGEQAGKALGISRPAVAKWRERLGINNMLLTPGNIEEIKEAKKRKKHPANE